MQLSVLMAVRNGAKFLPNSINDIERNVSHNDEILVVNDGSGDDTEKILLNWAEKNRQVRILTTKSLGFANALNLGLVESSNAWIARFDVDDSYPSNRLSIQREMVSNEISAIFCDYKFWSEKNSNLGVIPGAIDANATTVSLVSSQRTPHPGVIYNKAAVMEAGGYRNEDFPAEDLSLWLRMAKFGKLISIPKVLLNYRLSNNSMSGSNRRVGISKRTELTMGIGIEAKYINACLSNWRDVFKVYDGNSMSNERKLLFYRDLRNAIGICENQIINAKEINYIERSLIQDWNSYPALFRMASGKRLRNRFRQI
jgi:glycosyltransferase involved in cell wall biosynthesis